MGIFDGIFGTPKKRVTEKEYKKVKGSLYSEGFNRRQRERVDEIFKPDFYEKPTTAHPRGLETSEIDARIKWMRENKSKHHFSDTQIDKIERELKERI